MAKGDWLKHMGLSALGAPVTLYNAFSGGDVTDGLDNLISGTRKKHPGRVLDTQDQILGKYDDYVDESGVRGQMSKFSDLAGMFGDEASKSYLDTTEGMSFTRMIEDASKKKRDRLRQDSSMMNLTPEAMLAGQGQISEQEGASMNQLVSGADSRRRALRSQQMQALSQVLGGEQGLMGAQQGRFAQSLGAAQGIYGQGAQMQAQSNQALMNLMGGFMESAGTLASGGIG